VTDGTAAAFINGEMLASAEWPECGVSPSNAPGSASELWYCGVGANNSDGSAGSKSGRCEAEGDEDEEAVAAVPPRGDEGFEDSMERDEGDSGECSGERLFGSSYSGGLAIGGSSAEETEVEVAVATMAGEATGDGLKAAGMGRKGSLCDGSALGEGTGDGTKGEEDVDDGGGGSENTDEAELVGDGDGEAEEDEAAAALGGK